MTPSAFFIRFKEQLKEGGGSGPIPNPCVRFSSALNPNWKAEPGRPTEKTHLSSLFFQALKELRTTAWGRGGERRAVNRKLWPLALNHEGPIQSLHEADPPVCSDSHSVVLKDLYLSFTSSVELTFYGFQANLHSRLR